MNSNTNNLGQKPETWDDFWKGISPLSEIQMWDYYGGRQWITKYVPRNGKTIEGGCGTGRYIFYLSRMGIDIEGLDFSDEVLVKLKETAANFGTSVVLTKGDVTALPYPDNALSGYISLGVMEHFIEGPHKAIAEAYRVLRPGGIAIITTPNKSFFIRYRNFKKQLKNAAKYLLGIKQKPETFFQYEYSPKQLKKFLELQKFYVSRVHGCDLLYPFVEIGNFSGNNIQKGSFAYWFANCFENTPLQYYGAQSITVSVKIAPVMHCFLSGKPNAYPQSLEKYDVPISEEMQKSPLAALYLKNRRVKYAEKYIINPPYLNPQKQICNYTGEKYVTDPLFENFGFNVPVSPTAIKDINVNIDLCCNHIKPLWRKRED